jgi:hypothetical protein
MILSDLAQNASISLNALCVCVLAWDDAATKKIARKASNYILMRSAVGLTLEQWNKLILFTFITQFVLAHTPSTRR